MVRIFANSDMYVTADDLEVFTVFIKMDGIRTFQFSVKKKLNGRKYIHIGRLFLPKKTHGLAVHEN